MNSKVLVLQFATADGKKHSLRIKNADRAASTELIQGLADNIVRAKAFDFDGKQSPYTFKSATFVTTDKQAIIPAAK